MGAELSVGLKVHGAGFRMYCVESRVQVRLYLRLGFWMLKLIS